MVDPNQSGMKREPRLRLETNADGNFFVDSSCIDCDACRQIAPATFARVNQQSAVVRQPQSRGELLSAGKALISCPTASIVTVSRVDLREALGSYPESVEGDVYRCGFTSEDSFGAFSYLISRPEGNILIDSPRFSGPLVKRIEGMGGVSLLAMTHADDVADHAKFGRRFGCERLLHAADVSPDTADVEVKPDSNAPVWIRDRLLMIPTPGHTRGHAVFLYDETFLFTGDHLAWNATEARLHAFRGACWYSWKEQIHSMERLLDYRFEWILPGHGRPVRLPAEKMHEQLGRCVEWMRKVA